MHSIPVNLRRLLASAAAAGLATAQVATAAPLFEDNFDTDTRANWDLKTGYYAETTPTDYTADWAFDYSTQKYKRFAANGEDFEEFPIPPAPNGSGTTRGLKLTVNQTDDLAERIAVNLFPKGKSFGGNYVLKFDLWMNYNGPAEGGVGSTEHFLAGINHSGNIVNWHSFVIGFTNSAALPGSIVPGVGAEASDGIWIAYTGEGGAGIDGRIAFGTTNGPSTYYNATANPPIGASPAVPAGFLDRDGDNSPDNSDQDTYVAKTLFPQPKFETAGAPGKRWVEMEISQVDDVITWKADGKLFAQFPNPTGYKSGNIMIGYMDIFNSIPDPREDNFVIFDNVRVEPVRKVVVDTADNASGPNDGRTSLVEALTNLQENDHISFNLPGAGPHVLVTPIGGYPLITKAGVTIDGFTQPGASPNTLPFLEGNNAKIQVFLDSSSDAQTGDPAKPNRASTRLPYPGYGDSENAILGILEADNVTIRGLGFLGRHTPGSDEDPSIYAIALVKEARNARVQGNWFGLAPDGTTVKGFSSAVAGFRHRVNVDGVNVDTFSGGLVVGTDSDGVNDAAEGNVLCGLHIALALELPEAITAGNYFNVRPDGKTFLNVDDIHQSMLDAGRAPGDSSVENYENGRDTTGSVIGVRGDGINDAYERNVFNYVVYDHLIEFYSSATNVVIAGNYFGVGVDGVTTAPLPSELTPNLFEGPGSGSIRFGSNNDGVADDLEGNVVHKVPGTGFVIAGASVPVVARRNTLVGNAFVGFPFADGANGRTYEAYYAPYVANAADIVPTVTSYTDKKLSGKAATPLEGYFADIDVYVVDSLVEPEIQPGQYLGTFFLDAPDDDLNPAPGEFTFDLSGLTVPGGKKLCVVPVYTALEDASEAGSSVTGPVSSNTVETGGSVSEPIGNITAARDGSNLRLTWATGTPPFQVQRRDAVASGTWTNVGNPVNEKTATVPMTGAAGFIRVQGQ